MRNFSYELELFRRFEKVRVNGTPITELKIHGDKALWQRFHQGILGSDVKEFAKNPSRGWSTSSPASFKKRSIGAAFFIATLLTIVSAIASFWFRPRVLVFSVDKISDVKTRGDFRLGALYAVLRENKVTFVECFHTNLDRFLLPNFFKRKRPALYLEAFDWLWYW